MDWETIARLDKSGLLPFESDDFTPIVGAKAVLYINDTHGRWIDWSAWRVVKEVMKRVLFDDIIWNGDVLDFYEFSRYHKDPDVERSLQEDIDAWLAVAYGARNLQPDARMHFVPGNHEERYELYLQSDAKRLRGLKFLQLPEIMMLPDLDITPHGVNGFEVYPNLYAFHGETVRKHTGQSAMGEMDRWGMNGCSGHVHRLGVYRRKTFNGSLSWAEGGCLCDLNPTYMKGKPNWHHGITIAHYLPSGQVFFEQVEIRNGECAFRGELITTG